jgi:hypothetical protein
VEKKYDSFQVPEDGQNTVMCDLRFLSANSGNDWMGSADWPTNKPHELKLYMFSSAYNGVEAMCTLKFTLQDANKVSKFKYHPEDAALGKLTSIYSLLGQPEEPEVDSDFEDGTRAAKHNHEHGDDDDDHEHDDHDEDDEDGGGGGEEPGEINGDD